MPRLQPTPADARIFSHVVKEPARADCWIWTVAIGDDGYGRLWMPNPNAANGPYGRSGNSTNAPLAPP